MIATIIISAILIAVLLVSMSLFRVFYDTEVEDGDHIVIRAAISGSGRSYYFTVDENRNLISYRGAESNFNIFEEFEPNDYLAYVNRKRRTRISEQDMQYLTERLERLQELDYEYSLRVALGGVDFFLWHNGVQYHIDINRALDPSGFFWIEFDEPKEIAEIAQKIIELSPMASYMSEGMAAEPPFAWFEDLIDDIQRSRRSPRAIPNDIEIIESDLNDLTEPE